MASDRGMLPLPTPSPFGAAISTLSISLLFPVRQYRKLRAIALTPYFSQVRFSATVLARALSRSRSYSESQLNLARWERLMWSSIPLIDTILTEDHFRPDPFTIFTASFSTNSATFWV